jgi:hypothetical protein
MNRTVTLALLVLAALASTGCYGQVQRTITIESEPAGALVWLNDNEIGRTPVTIPFTWYGTYGVRLEAPGYVTLVTTAEVKAPMYEWVGLDLFSETVAPGIKHNDFNFSYVLKHYEPVDMTALRERAEGLRRDAQEGAP